jgi:hypothetical protein
MADFSTPRGWVRAENWVSQYLSNGATIHAIGNYIGGVEQFKYTPTKKVELHRLITYIQDTGNFAVSTYGNGITLGVGLRVVVRHADDTLVQALDGGEPIKSNADWSSLCYDINYHSFGTGDNALAVRWTFERAGAPILIDGTLGEYLAVELNDSFTALTDHTFNVQGIVI